MTDNPDVLSIWVVYRKPKDYPEHYIARRWEMDQPTTDIITSITLDNLRDMLPDVLVRMERNDEDDPVIVETWL